MSHLDVTEQDEGIGYVLENNGLISSDFGQTDSPESQYGNVVYSDGTILVHNGQYFISTDGEAIVLQDREENYSSLVISDEGEDSQNTELSEKNSIQYIQQSENGDPVVYYELSDDNSIQFLHSRDLVAPEEIQEEENDASVKLLIDEPKMKRIKIENSEEELEDDEVQFQFLDSEGNVLIGSQQIPTTANNGKKYQFAVLRDNRLQLHTIESDDVGDVEGAKEGDDRAEEEADAQLREELAAFEETIKLQSQIIGKNLITGQVVTLDHYFDKIYNGAKKSDLNREIFGSRSAANASKTKKFVGKIISIQKPGQESTDNIETHTVLDSFSNNLEESTENGDGLIENFMEVEEDSELIEKLQKLDGVVMKEIPVPPCGVEDDQIGSLDDLSGVVEEQEVAAQQEVVENRCEDGFDEHMVVLDHTFFVSEENLGIIKKTLEGLMQMESVQNKMMYKNLQVKLVERRFSSQTNDFKKTVCYTYGRMELVQEDTNNEEDDESKIKWAFIVDESEDSLTNEISDGIDCSTNKSNAQSVKDFQGFQEMTSIVITNTINKGGSTSLRVKLNDVTKAPTCKICNHYFKSPAHLRKHFLMMHQEDQQFLCSTCDMTFPDSQTLAKHKKTHEKWVSCTVCNKSFSSQSSLKRHMTIHDKSLRALECSVCHARFTSEYNLKKHLVIHTGIRPYSCEKCHRSFVYQSDLNFHKKIHDSAKLVCKTCGREFSRYSNLLRHEEIHKGHGALYKCEMCGCSYNYASSLTRHMVQNHIKIQTTTPL